MFRKQAFLNPITNDYEDSGLLVRVSNGDIIPPVEENIDYQEYLAWVEEGNVPEEWNPEEA